MVVWLDFVLFSLVWFLVLLYISSVQYQFILLPILGHLGKHNIVWCVYKMMM